MKEIYDYASVVISVRITGIMDNTVADRTSYTFEVKDVLKGTVNGEQWVTAFKDSMTVGEEYILLLDKPEETSVFYIMCSPRSILAASGSDAELVWSLNE